MRILISGGSITGPVLAYWLVRSGHTVTVVERAPTLRKTGGHAVDLFRPAMDISERMGVIERIEAKATGATRMTVHREDSDRPVVIDLDKFMRAASDRHVEIMRDDLSEIYIDATRDDVEYVFDDSITELTETPDDVEVAFENAAPRRFDLVLGADGIHSNVRRLVFGDESRYGHFVGAYLAVLSVPRSLGAGDEYVGHFGVGRFGGIYRARHMEDARAVFMFRSPYELDYHYRDIPRQKELLREHFAGMHPDIDRWLEELDRTPSFYFDAVTQIRLDTWTKGRIALAGDAGYCPGPAIGGSTSLAVVGAYALAGELAEADGDHVRGFQAYEMAMRDNVRGARAFALGAAKTLIPRSRFALWALANGARLFTALPGPVARALANLNTKGVRMHDSMPVRDYGRLAVGR